MKILILLSAFLATANYALAEESRPPGCKDPTYACQDLSTARICGVVSDCIHDIWSTMKAPDDDDNEICDICKEMVKEARDQLLSNETQEEIKQVFEGSCELLAPILPKVIVDKCKEFFDDIIPEIIEMLASRMDPNTVCTVAGLCNNAALKESSLQDRLSSIMKYVSSAINDDSCGSCKNLLSAVKRIVSTIPQDKMQDILLHLCQLSPEFSAQCSAMVESYLPQAYNYILSMDPATTCQEIGVCSESNEIQVKPLKFGDDLTCEFCESLVQYLRDFILTNSTKEEFKTALLNMCSRMGSFSNECKELVNEYFDMVYDFIDKSLVPKKVCTDLGLCQPGDKKTVPMVKIVPMNNMWRGRHPNRIVDISPIETQNSKPMLRVRVIPAKMDTKKSNNAEQLQQDSPNEIVGISVQQLPIERMQNPLLTFTNDIECAFSKAIMYFLEKDLKARNTKAINTALDNVCETWLPGYPKECENFVSGNRKRVTELLLLGVPFDGVPAYLKSCHDEAKPVGPQTHGNNGITCDLCLQVMDYLKKNLGDNKTEEEIREALDNVCTYLPQTLVQDCKQFVNEYTDTIVKLLLQEIDPNAICQAIRLCPGEIHKPVKDNLDCKLCKQIMAYVKSKLAEPAIESDIQKILDEVCSILPASWGSKCQQFVDQYTTLIITLLLQEVDPDEICTMLHVCSSVASTGMKAVETKPATLSGLKDSADCEICTAVMGYLEKELEDQTVESAIRQALDTVCSVLPSSYAVKCQQFVDKYTDKIINLLVNNISPKMVCSLLQECPSGNVGCILCQYALHFVQEQLMSSSAESEIKAVAKEFCSYLPAEVVAQCNAFVNEYGDALIVLLAQKLDPSIICPLLKLCASNNLPEELPPAPLKSIKIDSCDICKTVVNTIDHLLEEGDIDKDLTDWAAKVCNLLPETSKEECNSIVHLYGPYFLQMIGRLVNGQELCQSIDLCAQTPGHVHLLGAEKCTFGPSYWCKSHAHAAACKAEIYCKKRVWKN